MDGRFVKFNIWQEDLEDINRSILVYQQELQLYSNENGGISNQQFKIPYCEIKGFDPNPVNKYYGDHPYFIEIDYSDDVVSSGTPPITVNETAEPTSTVSQGSSVQIVGEGTKPAEIKTETCPNCDKDISLEQMKAIFTTARDSDLTELLNTLNKYRKKFGLDSCVKKAHFFAQAIQESGRDLSGALKGESLNYSPQGLATQFDNFRAKYVVSSNKENTIYKGKNGERLAYKDRNKAAPSEEAYRYGRHNGHPANQKMIATIAYRQRNGNELESDGWDFKGRGLLQITGRTNYEKVQQQINRHAPESEINLLSEVSESGYTPLKAAISGLAEWKNKNLDSIASKGTKTNDNQIVDNIVNVLNLRTNSRAKRKENYKGKSNSYKGTKEIFKINECKLLSDSVKEEGKINTGRAPWVDIAFAEFEKYKGLREKDSPLKEQIHEYFCVSSTGRYKDSRKTNKWNYNDPWCGAFVAWCFEKTKDYKSYKSLKSAAAFGWTSGNWTKGERSDVFVGAIIVFSWSHVAIIIGENEDGTRYVYLGGNQTGWEGRKENSQVIGMSSIRKTSSDIKAITKPKDYEISDDEKKLPKYNVNTENDFNSTR